MASLKGIVLLRNKHFQSPLVGLIFAVRGLEFTAGQGGKSEALKSSPDTC